MARLSIGLQIALQRVSRFPFGRSLVLGSLLPLVGCGDEEAEPSYLTYVVADTLEIQVPEQFSDFCEPGQRRLRPGERVPDPPPWSEGEAVAFQGIHYDDAGYIGIPVRCVVRQQEQWDELYSAIGWEPSVISEFALDTQMLLVVGMGRRSSTGFGIRVTAVRRTAEDNLLVVVLNSVLVARSGGHKLHPLIRRYSTFPHSRQL